MRERTFWERVEEYPIGKLMLYVFLFALSERLIVILVFFFRWGFHTVSGIELWFYYGVAKGIFDLYSVWDPSWWILKTLGALFRGEVLLYSVYAVSSVSSSLNSALFCLLVSELHGKKTGFLAGLIYGSMVLPMFNSAGTVTHDIFAYPYLLLALYGALMVFKRRGLVKIPFAGLCVLALFLGRQVGPTIYVGVGTIIIYLLWRGVRAFLSSQGQSRVLALILLGLLTIALISYGSKELFGVLHLSTLFITAGCVVAYFLLWQWIRVAFAEKGWFDYLTVAVFLLVICGLLTALHYQVMPALMEKTFDLALAERAVDVRAQIKAGSGDLLGSSLGDYWLRFNFLLLFLPVGLVVAFKKKDVMGWALILVGFLASLAADRGTRPFTFGFALMGALAFVNWKRSYDWILVVWMGFIIGILGGRYSTEYAVFFPVAVLFIYLSIQWPFPGERSYGSWLVFVLTMVWIVAGGIMGGIAHVAKVTRSPETMEQLQIIRKYWTVQSCVLVPVLLLFLESVIRRPRFPRSKKDRQWKRAQQWFKRGSVKWVTLVALFIFYLTLIQVGIYYTGIIRGSSLFPAGGFLRLAQDFIWKNIHIIFPVAAGILIFIFGWPTRAAADRKFLTGVAVVCWLFATIIPSMNQTTKSTEGEYRIYKWLSENVEPGGKIFVPWSDGYLAEAVSNLTSELSAHKIDFELPRLYWMPEEKASEMLRERGIKYIIVSSKYFRILGVNRKSSEFKYAYSPDILYQPDQVGVTQMSQLQQTTLFKLLYGNRVRPPLPLEKFKLLKMERDEEAKETYQVYEVLF